MSLGSGISAKLALCGAIMATLSVGCKQSAPEASATKDGLTGADIDLFKRYSSQEMIIGPDDACSLQTAVGEVVTKVTKKSISGKAGYEQIAPFLWRTHRNALAGWDDGSRGCMHALLAGCGENKRASGYMCFMPGTGLLLRDASNGDVDMRKLFVAHWLFVHEQTFHYLVGNAVGSADRLMSNLAEDANDQEIRKMAADDIAAAKAIRENRLTGEAKMKTVIDAMVPKLRQIGVPKERIDTFLKEWEKRSSIAR